MRANALEQEQERGAPGSLARPGCSPQGSESLSHECQTPHSIAPTGTVTQPDNLALSHSGQGELGSLSTHLLCICCAHYAPQARSSRGGCLPKALS